jgi:phosphatidylserine/phosphatidylglycerophosphate/cardiolipin synthase-like enzyme
VHCLAHSHKELCSGFFQEKKYKVTSYYASQSFINNSPKLPCRLTLTTVGVYDKHHWGQQYDDFVNALKTIKCCCGFSIKVKKRAPKTSNKWHAKVFIVRKNGVPQLAIIGSSNITKNAFDEMKTWNRECDVIIWNEKNIIVDHLVRQSITNRADFDYVTSDEKGQHVIISRYDNEDPLNSDNGSIEDRLNLLWNEIISETKDI